MEFTLAKTLLQLLSHHLLVKYDCSYRASQSREMHKQLQIHHNLCHSVRLMFGTFTTRLGSTLSPSSVYRELVIGWRESEALCCLAHEIVVRAVAAKKFVSCAPPLTKASLMNPDSHMHARTISTRP